MRVILFTECNSPFGAAVMARISEHHSVKDLLVLTRDPARLCDYYFYDAVSVSIPKMARLRGRSALETDEINSPATIERLRSFEPDVIVLANYQLKVKDTITSLAKRIAINFHPSPLPRYAGLAPFFWMARNGETDAGVSCCLVEDKIDGGALVHSAKVALTGNETSGEIREKLFTASFRQVTTVFDMLADGTVTPQPQDPQARNDVGAWLFGDWLLVSPVVEQGQTVKRIYLPAGTWTDWASGKVYPGGQTITVATDATTWRDIPLFVRAGAIIPTQPVMDYVGEHPVATVAVDVFPAAAASHFDYYDDDGETYAYQHGDYYQQRLATRRNGDTVSFSIAAPEGSYRPALRGYLVRVHGIAADSITAGNATLRHYATPAELAAAGGEGWIAGSDRYGPLTVLKLAAGVGRTLTLHAGAAH